MGRPIEFNESRVIENAMQAFWAQGVQAMTVAEMLEATGLARSSFYNSYGTKEALVVKAIERYCEMDLAALREVLAGPSFRCIVDLLLLRVIDDVKKSVDAGFDAHIAKPPDPHCIERLFVDGG